MFKIVYSQNFLRSAKLVRALIERSSIKHDDLVLDIGAGKGVITDQLLIHCRRVEAIEKDRALCEGLKRLYGNHPRVDVRCCDFMTYSLPSAPYKVFANIPYTRTTDILRKLLDASNPPQEAWLVVQREAAFKYVGCPYQHETLTSLAFKPWFDFRI